MTDPLPSTNVTSLYIPKKEREGGLARVDFNAQGMIVGFVIREAHDKGPGHIPNPVQQQLCDAMGKKWSNVGVQVGADNIPVKIVNARTLEMDIFPEGKEYHLSEPVPAEEFLDIARSVKACNKWIPAAILEEFRAARPPDRTPPRP